MSDAAPADEATYEYAIELPGQGWLLNKFPGNYCVVAEPVIVAEKVDYAWEVLEMAQKFYRTIGAEVVGDQLRLVVRTVTVTRSDWEEAAR